MKNPILEQFIVESRDYIQRIGEILIELEQKGSSSDLLNELFRIVHTLKGNSGIFNFTYMTKLLHAAEDLMNRMRDGVFTYTSEIADLLLETTDIVSQMIDQVEAYGEPEFSTNELAQRKTEEIRKLLFEGRREETATKEEETEKIDPSKLSETLRIKAVKLLFEGKNVKIVLYTPIEDCFYKGDDPFLFAKTTPKLLFLRAYLRESVEDPLSFDLYRCITNFEIISEASSQELKEHFQYVLDQIELFEPKISELIAPSGDHNGGQVYEDFVEEFREILKYNDKERLKNSINAVLELTGENLFVASCLRWIRELIDFIPVSTPYIEALLKSIETKEAPKFAIPEVITSTEQKPTIKETKEFLPLDPLTTEIILEQRKVLEELEKIQGEIRRGTFNSIITAIENALRTSKNQELINRFEALKNQSDHTNYSKILEFIEQIEKEETHRVKTEPLQEETPRRIEPVQEKEEKISTKQDEQKSIKFLRVDEDKVNRFMNLIGELVVAKNSLLYLAKKIETELEIPELSKEIKSQYSVVNRIAEEMQDAIMQIRMIPVSTVFQRFPRLVRDISKKIGKQVKLEIIGEDTEADKNVIEALGDPLIHLIRNSLDHGIETPEERLSQGKEETATIKLKATHEADRVIIEVEDDGRGIDPEKVKRKAYEKGLITEETLEKISDEEAINLIFLPGFSTKEESSELSGRGVGMDVVRNMVERFNGSVNVWSKKGFGTKVTISLPLSMAVSHVMLIDTASRKFGIPMDAVIETVRIRDNQIRIFKGRRVTSLRGKVVPILFLNEILAIPQQPLKDEDNQYAVLIANIRGETVGLVVDKFLGTADIILKPFTGFLSQFRLFSGTAIMGDGTVLLVINPKELA